MTDQATGHPQPHHEAHHEDHHMGSMARLVRISLRKPVFILLLAVVVALGGVAAFHQLNIEAYPNPVPPLVEVITQPQGLSAEEVERQITVPLEVALAGMPGLDHIRSQSLFGLSDVKCYFNWGTDYKDGRQEVINRLQFALLPNGLQAQISPWNAIGEIFRYRVIGKGYTLQDLKAAQDWILERQFKQVPGVVDVVAFGGLTKEYHVEVDPNRLRAFGITLSQLNTAIANANQNVGGQRLTLGEQSFTVRGVGLISDLNDIGNITVGGQKGTPVRLRDVAQISEGSVPRLGIVGKDKEPDVVEGTILMSYGGETLPTLDGIHQRIEYIRKNHLLPPGMDVQPFYDRGTLVGLTTHTVIENLFVGMLLVTLILIIFLGDYRAALIAAINIPLALLIAFSGMVLSRTSANLISLGAVDFGIVVDATVIMMENIVHHAAREDGHSVRKRILDAAVEVAGPVLFSTIIIAVAFLPLFTMTGVEGVIFSPMARTYAFAIGGAILLSFTLTPVLAAIFLKRVSGKPNAVMTFLNRFYRPAAERAMRHPRISLAFSLVAILACGFLFPILGREFMPTLEEGNLWIRATLPTSISLEQSAKYVSRMREIVARHSEVTTVLSQLGRPDDGTDVSGFFNIELFAPLKPFDEWPRGVTKETLTDELSKEFQESFPGVSFNFSQMISDNVEEAMSGIKGENSVKIIGPDLRVNEAKANGIVDVMSKVPGVKDLGMFQSLGQPSITITPDRVQIARYGLNTGDVEAVVQAAIGGQAVTQVFEGEKRFDLTVRWLEPFRSNLREIRNITVPTPDGANIPLTQLARIEEEVGPSIIYREDGHRYSPVKFSVRGKDLGSTIAEAQTAVQKSVPLPYDTHTEWAGQINELKEAQGRLLIIVPLTILLIGLITHTAVKNWTDTLIVLVAIPVACTGGVLALLLTHINFSISAAMGFISIFGIAIQDGLLVVTYFQRHRKSESSTVFEAASYAADKGFRPMLMATVVAILGLLPAALSNGIGSQTQKPLAVVVIGGCLTLALLTRILRPPLLVLAHGWMDRDVAADDLDEETTHALPQ
ncbi:MAG TPA: CusA/CzcA family heavy metal efflux RND transporter [Thermoanaerobaculia bacterium]|jgi:cobalt-zinc-cadmium resistance protein CzcA|nr:CusA/CzcA family heavy metal efflux RND transporter [Thermoanaerobaculia bacterium]